MRVRKRVADELPQPRMDRRGHGPLAPRLPYLFPNLHDTNGATPPPRA
jgi:hypothetical protein